MNTKAASAISHASVQVRALNPHVFLPANASELHLSKPLPGKDFEKSPKDRMNQTERRMADWLAAQVRRGEIIRFEFEGLRLKWGEDPRTKKPMHYKPDFTIFDKSGIRLIEVKGKRIWDRDTVRFKGCRAEWPEFRFELWQWQAREWTRLL